MLELRVTFKHFNCLSLIFKAVLIMSGICTFKVNKKKAAVLSFWLCRCPKQNKYHTANAKEHMRKKNSKADHKHMLCLQDSAG